MREKPTLKMLQASWFLVYFFKRFRSFNTANKRGVTQRATKLLAIKHWFDPKQSQIWAECFEWGQGRAADFFLRPPTLTASNFKALWPTDPIFTALKDLNLLKKYIKNQNASINYRRGFALLKRPYLDRAYLVTFCNQKLMAVNMR